MSIAIVPSTLGASPTWRQFQQACGCAFLAILAGCAIYGVETLILHSEHRFVENPADTMTRAIGVAHFSIGWLFLFTSPRIRNRAAVGRLTFWTAFGIAFCWVFWRFGDDSKNPLLLMAFYSFFFIHEVFDEAYLFRQSGELTEAGPEAERFLRSLCWSLSFALMTLLAAAQIVRGHFFGRSAQVQEMSTEWLVLGWALLAVLAGAAIAGTVRIARRSHGSLHQTIALYQPLFAVYTGLVVILVVGSLFGSIGANLVILVHGQTWLVATTRRLSERPLPVTGVWSWLRGTPTGFLTLHVAVIALTLFLFAMRTHVWQRSGIVCDMLSRTWFPYWSIMHIAMAFWRTK